MILHKLSLILAGAAIGSFFMAGCASGIKAVEVLSGKESETPGIRYHLTAPYLIIAEGSDGKWDARLEFGPDLSRQFAIQPFTYFAASTYSITYDSEGAVKSFVLNQDGTTVSEAMVNALKDVALKKLELQQEAATAAAGQKSTAVSKSDAPNLEFHVYRVAGRRLLPGGQAASHLLMGSATSSGLPANWDLRLVGKTWTLAFDTQGSGSFTEADKKEVKFLAASGGQFIELPPEENAKLQQQVTVLKDSITWSDDLGKDKGVVAVKFRNGVKSYEQAK